MAKLFGCILLVIAISCDFSKAELNDEASGNTNNKKDTTGEENKKTHKNPAFRILSHSYLEYMIHVHASGLWAYKDIQNSIVLKDNDFNENSSDVVYVRGPLRVLEETNASVVVKAWNAAFHDETEARNKIRSLLDKWLYHRHQIQLLNIFCTIINQELNSHTVHLVNGQPQKISMPTMKCNCQQYNVSVYNISDDQTDKLTTHIEFLRSLSCTEKHQKFSLHQECPVLPNLEYLLLTRVPIFNFTINDLVHFRKLKTIALDSVLLTCNGLENKLLCSMNALQYFTYENSFQNLKQFPSQIFNCADLLETKTIAFKDHAIEELPPFAYKSAAHNVRTIFLDSSGIKFIDRNAFSGMTHLEVIYITDNPLFQTLPLRLPSSHNLSALLIVQHYQPDSVLDASMLTKPYCSQFRMFTCLGCNITKLVGDNICCSNSVLEAFLINRNNLTELTGHQFTKCISLRYLLLHRNNLVYFELPPLPHVEHLSLAYNALNDSNQWSFLLQHPMLRYLNISANTLTKWTLNLTPLKHLKEIDLSRNQISYITSDIFQNMTQMEFIDLGYNKLTEIDPQSMLHLTQLTGLVLRNNELTETANNFAPMLNSNMSVLDIAFNNLTAIHIPLRTVCTGSCLPQSIIADSNTLSDFTLACSPYQRYDSVSLTRNNLTNFFDLFPDPLKSPCHITLMDVSNNKLNSNFIGKLTKVVEYEMKVTFYSPLRHFIGTLILQHCGISDLLKSSFSYFNLGLLDLRYNHIQVLDELEIPSPPFTVIDITSNPLTCSCVNLWLKYHLLEQSQRQDIIQYKASDCTDLVIGLNYTITSISNDDWFLCQTDCPTDIIPACNCGFCYYSTLRSDITALDCISSRNTTKIPSAFLTVKYQLIFYGANLQELMLPYTNDSQVYYLDLSSNNITSVPDFAFIRLPLLDSLSLAFNSITHISFNTFKRLDNLVYLDLSFNNLNSIEADTFTHMNLLRYLYLHNNQLAVLSPAAINPLHNLHNISLYGNPWDCTHYNESIGSWLLDNLDKVQSVNDTRCNTSGELVILRNTTQLKITHDIHIHLNTHTMIIISTLAGLLAVTVIVLCVLYKYRFYVAVLIITYAPKLPCMKKKVTEETRHGIFFIYDDQDIAARSWMKNELVPHVEPDWPVICLDKNFPAGIDMADNIKNAITVTQCAVVLLTKDFLQYHWSCKMFEAANIEKMEGGVRHPYKIIPLFADNITRKDIKKSEDCPASLIHVLYTQRSLSVSQRLFWNSLYYLLPPKSTLNMSHLPQGIFLPSSSIT